MDITFAVLDLCLEFLEVVIEIHDEGESPSGKISDKDLHYLENGECFPADASGKGSSDGGRKKRGH